MIMNKKGSMILWIAVAVFVLAAAYTVYNKYSKNFQLGGAPPQVEDTRGEDTGSGNNKDNSTGNSGDGNNGANDSKTTEKVMVPDFTLTDLEGKEVKLSDYRGKIVVLNFWAEWCQYCKEEMPDLEKVNKKFQEDGNAVVIAVNVGEKLDSVKKYFKENNFTMPVWMDYNSDVYHMLGIEGLPNTLIINSDGSLSAYIPGRTDEKTILDEVSKAK